MQKEAHILIKRGKLRQDREKNFATSKLSHRHQLSAYWKGNINSIISFIIIVSLQILILNDFNVHFRKDIYFDTKAISLQLDAGFFLDFRKIVICSWHLSKIVVLCCIPILKYKFFPAIIEYMYVNCKTNALKICFLFLFAYLFTYLLSKYHFAFGTTIYTLF